MKLFRLLMLALLVIAALPAMQAGSVEAAIEAHGAHTLWYEQFVVALKQAAENGPARHSGGDRVRRHVEDIEYHVSSMINAVQADNRAKALEESTRIAALLDRARDKGYFNSNDVDGLLQHLQKYVPLENPRANSQ